MRARSPTGRTVLTWYPGSVEWSRTATQEAGDRVERSLRRGQADALGVVGDLGQAFEREREVGAPLGSRDRVNLVDDDPPNGGEDLPGP